MSQNLKFVGCLVYLAVSVACAMPSDVLAHPKSDPLMPGSVALLIDTSEDNKLCSGVLIAPSVVATARHCTHGATSITVVEPNTGHMSLAMRVVEDPSQDRAEIHTMSAFTHVATVGQTLDRRPVHVQGFGCSKGARLEQRAALFYSPEGSRRVVWTGRACGGDSGGGVWNADGKLVAIMTDAGYLFDHGRKINIVVGELL